MNENGTNGAAGTLTGEIIRQLRSERDELATRVAELEQALAPFAELLLTECNDSQSRTMADHDLMPVPMRLVRHAARAHAGTN